MITLANTIAEAATVDSQVIRTVSAPEEGARAVETIVRAFAADPAARWLFPDADIFADAFPRFVRAFAGRALQERSAHFTPGFAGAALWFAPGTHADEESVIRLLEQSVPPARLGDAFNVFEQMDVFHPIEPHWYLPMIGVEPAQQGRGLGSALLRHALAHCDRTGVPAYLEASSAASLLLYARHGFREVGEIRSGSSPTLYPMRREPQQAS